MNINYLANNGFAIRMITQTRLLDRLSNAGISVSLFVQDSDDALFTSNNWDDRIKVNNFNFTLGRIESELFLLRRYVFEDVFANPALLEKHVKGLKSPVFLIRTRYKVLDFINKRKIIKKLLRSVVICIEKSYALYFCLCYYRLLKGENLWVSTYPSNWREMIFCKSVKMKGQEMCLHLLSWDNLTTKGSLGFEPNLFLAWGEIMIEEYLDLYPQYKTEIVKVGVPHFDIYFSSKLESSYNNVFFGMSSPYFAPKEIDLVEEVAKWIEDEAPSDTVLVVRPHPQNITGYMADESWLDRLKDLRSPKVLLDWPILKENSKNSWSLDDSDMWALQKGLSRSLVVLNSGSTLSLDAMAAGKNVIITSYDGEAQLDYYDSARRLIDYPHLRKLIRFDGVTVVRSSVELLKLLKEAIKNRKGLNQKGKEDLKKQIGFLDGNNTQRVVDALIDYVKRVG